MHSQISNITKFNQTPLKVFYDGLCPLCSREIDHYREKENSQRIEFIDIAAPWFKPKEEGLDPKDVHKKFHVKTTDGKIISGVDAFVKIWETLEIWMPLQSLAKNPLSRPVFEAGYFAFAKVRPWFRNNKCTTDYCQTDH